MLIYMAGNSATDELCTVIQRANQRRLLISYAYQPADLPAAVARVARFRAAGVTDLFVDSGAYTAHTMGRHVGLVGYERFVAAVRPDRYAALDVLGDEEATRRNLDRMRSDGFDPIPVFTRGAGFAELKRYAEEAPIVALGNLVGRGVGHRDAIGAFLDAVFGTVRDSVALHGFGVGAAWMLERWPFASVDTASAIRNSGVRRVMRADGLRLPTTTPIQTTRAPHLIGDDTETRFQRIVHNLRQYQALEARVTNLWAARGVAC